MCSNWPTRISIVALILIRCAMCAIAAPPPISWSTQFGTPYSDDASGISLDHSGHLFITGSTNGVLGQTNLGGSDAYLAKYDLNGSQVWRQQFGGTSDDFGVKVASD